MLRLRYARTIRAYVTLNVRRVVILSDNARKQVDLLLEKLPSRIFFASLPLGEPESIIAVEPKRVEVILFYNPKTSMIYVVSPRKFKVKAGRESSIALVPAKLIDKEQLYTLLVLQS